MMPYRFVQILVTMIIVIDPVGQVPLFISLTSGMDGKKRAKTMWTAVAVAFSVLLLFILVGSPLLRLLGISPGAFYVSGGILLLLLSIDMLYGKPKRSQTSAQDPVGDASNPAIFPLAIPMLSGPGAITTIILYMSGPSAALETGGMLAASVVATLFLAVGAMSLARLLLKILGTTGVIVMERIMGLLLAGRAVQFAYEGIKALGLLG